MFVKSPTVEAKVGLWGDVFEKLDEKPDLINSTAGTTPLKPDDDDVPEAGACDGVHDDDDDNDDDQPDANADAATTATAAPAAADDGQDDDGDRNNDDSNIKDDGDGGVRRCPVQLDCVGPPSTRLRTTVTTRPSSACWP